MWWNVSSLENLWLLTAEDPLLLHLIVYSLLLKRVQVDEEFCHMVLGKFNSSNLSVKEKLVKILLKS